MLTFILGPNCSSGHVKSIFDNPVKKVFALSPKIFLEVVKKFQYKKKFEKKYSPKCSSGHVERSFENLAENFQLKSRKYYKFSNNFPKVYPNVHKDI